MSRFPGIITAGRRTKGGWSYNITPRTFQVSLTVTDKSDTSLLLAVLAAIECLEGQHVLWASECRYDIIHELTSRLAKMPAKNAA